MSDPLSPNSTITKALQKVGRHDAVLEVYRRQEVGGYMLRLLGVASSPCASVGQGRSPVVENSFGKRLNLPGECMNGVS